LDIDGFVNKYNTIKEWSHSLRDSNLENIKDKLGSTRQLYVRKLIEFDFWIRGKSIVYLDPYIAREKDGSVKKITATFECAEDMLNLLREKRYIDKLDFILLIERYLDDSKHYGLGKSVMDSKKNAINSYFRKFRTGCITDWMYKKNGSQKKERNSRSSKNKQYVTLEDMSNMIQRGKANSRDIAILMCMFQRGLDGSTMADRFNFQAWEQLVDYFGTENWNDWDLEKCPIPIGLERVKTDVDHEGYLEKDAIVCLQLYLDSRHRTTGTMPEINQPMILNTYEKPISIDFCRDLTPRLARNAEVQEKLVGKKTANGDIPNRIVTHKLRTLLETIIDNNVNGTSLANEAIGHKQGTYQNPSDITPETLRGQYSSIAPLINIISRMNHNMNGDDSEMRKIKIQRDTLTSQVKVYEENIGSDVHISNHILERYIKTNESLRADNEQLQEDNAELKVRLDLLLERLEIPA